MKRRRRGADGTRGPEIPLTPMIDLVFILLIFFMLAGHFMNERQVAVELPSSRSAKEAADGSCVVVVREDGVVYLPQVGPSSGEAEATRAIFVLLEGLKEEGCRSLEIRADRRASVESVLSVLDAARMAGFERAGMVTMPLVSKAGRVDE